MKKILTYIFLVLVLNVYYTASIKSMQFSASFELNEGKAAEAEIVDEIVEEGLEDDTELHPYYFTFQIESKECSISCIPYFENAHYPVIAPPPEA